MVKRSIRRVVMKIFKCFQKDDNENDCNKSVVSSNGEYYRSDERSNEMATIARLISEKSGNLSIFTFADLKYATKSFSKNQMVGEGGFGSVFRGFIKDPSDPQNKLQVAVKRLNKKGLQGHKEWVAEVQFLGLVNHPNLVKLLGYCAEDDERGFQRLLVYEFMQNKSLGDHLFSKNLPVLPWDVRLKIALGAAHGLTNLHEELEIQIIFRDFKPGNILLDVDFNPKLSDFGMARLGPTAGISHVSTAVVGTAGYAAPEYVQTGHLTSKSDVWSFGVVLCELLTGRKCMDKSLPKNEQKLLEWLKPHLTDPKKFRAVLDPRLQGQYSFRSALKLINLAQKCLTKHPKARPKMSDIVRELEQIMELSETSRARPSAGFPMSRSISENFNEESVKISANANKLHNSG